DVSYRPAPRRRVLPLSRQGGRCERGPWLRAGSGKRRTREAPHGAGRRGAHATRLSLGLAISSKPIEIMNNAMNSRPTTTIGASHHHHQPLITAPVKLTQ